MFEGKGDKSLYESPGDEITPMTGSQIAAVQVKIPKSKRDHRQ